MYKFISFLPETYFFCSITLIFLFCIMYNLSSILKYPHMYNNSIYISMVSLIYTFFLFLNNNVNYLDFSMMYKNQSNIMMSELLILICMAIFLTSIKYNKLWKMNYFEYSIFILISLGSFFIFLSLMNVVFMYIMLELQSMLISMLISMKKYNRYSMEASIKYFILGSFSSLMLLYGFSMIYGSTGLLSLHEMNLFFEYFEEMNNHLVFMSMKMSSIFILMGLLFKIYSAPFHFWLPDMYEGSPTSILMYMSTMQLFLMVIFFLKMYYYLLFDFIKLKQLIMYMMSILTLMFGSMGTLVQRKIKKLISFSAMTMNGFFLYSIVNNNSFLLETSITYLLVYMFTMLLLLSLLLNMFINDNKILVDMYDFFKIYSYNKSMSTILVILFFSVSGMPPFIGFMSKLFWLKTLIFEYNVFIFMLLLVFLIVSFYYISLVKNMYTFFNNKENTLFYIIKLPYESCMIFMTNQFLLFFFMFNSIYMINLVKMMLLDFFFM